MALGEHVFSFRSIIMTDIHNFLNFDEKCNDLSVDYSQLSIFSVIEFKSSLIGTVPNNLINKIWEKHSISFVLVCVG